MRVIAGKARGKKLLSPQTDKIRPTLDRVKESLFNIIGFEIRDCSFLDLFCGSGAIGIEAISRDADKVYFVDKVLKTGLQAVNNVGSITTAGYRDREIRIWVDPAALHARRSSVSGVPR